MTETARRRKFSFAGRPPLTSTIFVIKALAELPADVSPKVLYPAWLELHNRTEGFELADPKRSWRIMLKVAYRRAGRTTNHESN